MVKKRLIFTLLYSEGSFMLSRNFRLQRVGDTKWLNKNYNFANIATAIDELIILNVSQDEHSITEFCEQVKLVTEGCFMPLALGGGINCPEHAHLMISAGADKIVINTALHKNPALVEDLIRHYGSQCIIASVDYRYTDGEFIVFIDHGKEQITQSLPNYLEQLANIGVGEIYLNSMDMDGTGQGYYLDVLSNLDNIEHLPVIMAGGAGNYNHLLAGIQHPKIDAVATASLFNFIGDGLPSARRHLINADIELAQW